MFIVKNYKTSQIRPFSKIKYIFKARYLGGGLVRQLGAFELYFDQQSCNQTLSDISSTYSKWL